MAYRDDLIALTARHDALAAEVAAKTHELEASQQLLDQARSRARLPVLDDIRVAAPCSAAWSEMTGDDRTRHCGACQKNVYNLSGMTRDEAEALLIERNGDLCVRYYQRADGTILLADCAVGVRKRSRRRRTTAAAAALITGGVLAAMHVASRGVVMGKMAPHEGYIMGEVAAAPGDIDSAAGPAAGPATMDQAPAVPDEDAVPETAMRLPPELAAPHTAPHAAPHATPAHPEPAQFKMGKIARPR